MGEPRPKRFTGSLYVGMTYNDRKHACDPTGAVVNNSLQHSFPWNRVLSHGAFAATEDNPV
ncbi:MAG: hypothetical protein ACPF9K_14620 [Neptuniibacter sp.]